MTKFALAALLMTVASAAYATDTCEEFSSGAVAANSAVMIVPNSHLDCGPSDGQRQLCHRVYDPLPEVWICTRPDGTTYEFEVAPTEGIAR